MRGAKFKYENMMDRDISKMISIIVKIRLHLIGEFF